MLLSICGSPVAHAQEAPPFWEEIREFKKQDSVSFPAASQILFIGSSSFRMWTDIKSYFPGYPILNRSFGGSTLLDVFHYAKDVILPYKPRQVVIYCGENDLASSDTVTPMAVLKRFELLYYFIRKHYPKVPVVFISLKPSPSRQHLLPKMIRANVLVRNFLAKRSRTSFVDIYHKMLNPDGSPREELFLEDRLHMNADGYAIWKKAIMPHLLKNKK
jgi:lysophospholipase L1-like esterase